LTSSKRSSKVEPNKPADSKGATPQTSHEIEQTFHRATGLQRVEGSTIGLRRVPGSQIWDSNRSPFGFVLTNPTPVDAKGGTGTGKAGDGDDAMGSSGTRRFVSLHRCTLPKGFGVVLSRKDREGRLEARARADSRAA